MTGRGVPAGPASPGTARFAGTLFLGTGVFILAVATGFIEADPGSMRAPREVLACAGLAFALAGVLLVAQGRLSESMGGILAAALVTSLALIPTWLAFGPGTRRFDGSGTAIALLFEWDPARLGRIVFGMGAVLMWAYALFAWRSATQRLNGLVRSPVRLALFALLPWTLWGRTLEPRARPGESDADRLAKYIDALHSNPDSDASADGAPPAVVPREDAWIRAARARIAALRQAPSVAQVIEIPRAGTPPVIDGRIEDDEWRGSVRVPLDAEGGDAVALMLRAGDELFLAGEAPSDRTEKGFDQFRFYFHLDLTPRFDDERVFVDGNGHALALRSVRVGADADRRTEWGVLSGVRGGGGVIGHRQFELAIHLREAGLDSGASFPAFIEIEGDPMRDGAGRFRERHIEGRAGSRAAPLWLRLAR